MTYVPTKLQKESTPEKVFVPSHQDNYIRQVNTKLPIYLRYTLKARVLGLSLNSIMNPSHKINITDISSIIYEINKACDKENYVKASKNCKYKHPNKRGTHKLGSIPFLKSKGSTSKEHTKMRII